MQGKAVRVEFIIRRVFVIWHQEQSMLRSARENGPAALVPLAWLVVAAAHLGAVSPQALTIAHGVMSTLLAVFALLSWREMSTGALRGWRTIIVAGFGVTLLGLVGLTSGPDALLGVSLFGWMVLPAIGFAYTGRLIANTDAGGASHYTLAAVLTVAGTVVYAGGSLTGSVTAALLVGLGLVGVGQTIGIADATLRP